MRTEQERTLIVGVDVAGVLRRDGVSTSAEESLDELKVLAESAGAVVVDRILQHRPALEAATLIGSGKVAELQARAAAEEIDTVIFDRELTPTQLRNLERQLHCNVVDRTQLILDIFASQGAHQGRAVASGTGAVELPAAAAYRAGRADVAAGRRHRDARTRRNEARNGPAPDRPAYRKRLETKSTAFGPRAAYSARSVRRCRFRQSALSATRTPANRRCLTG